MASRVALERGESHPGEASVGYVVRGDSKMCSSTRLMFCTTGVLLRQLQSRNALENISHIVIDEVHERHLGKNPNSLIYFCICITAHLYLTEHTFILPIQIFLSQDTDVLLAILKQSLPSLPNLTVVLMSGKTQERGLFHRLPSFTCLTPIHLSLLATMDADRFAKYWGNCTPRMHIPGFTHPVKVRAMMLTYSFSLF